MTMTPSTLTHGLHAGTIKGRSFIPDAAPDEYFPLLRQNQGKFKEGDRVVAHLSVYRVPYKGSHGYVQPGQLKLLNK